MPAVSISLVVDRLSLYAQLSIFLGSTRHVTRQRWLTSASAKRDGFTRKRSNPASTRTHHITKAMAQQRAQRMPIHNPQDNDEFSSLVDQQGTDVWTL
jgi:hypothetical protein